MLVLTKAYSPKSITYSELFVGLRQVVHRPTNPYMAKGLGSIGIPVQTYVPHEKHHNEKC